MKYAIIFFLSAIFIFKYALASTPPSRGVTTCRTGQDCSWQQGRSVSETASSTEITETGDKIKISQNARASIKLPKSNNAKTMLHNSAILWEVSPGNLPIYFSGIRHSSSGGDGSFVIVPDKTNDKATGAPLAGLRAGDILPAELEQSIKASPSVPTPIRAKITAGRFRGAFILGMATLDRELKRILLTFEKMRLPANDMVYQLHASGLALSGQVGLEGDHHTQEGLFFAAELGAATAAGYADATTSRSQSLLSGYQTEPTAANAAKQGAVQALSKTAERFAERARTAPEYTEIEAGLAIQIIILESPTEVSGI